MSALIPNRLTLRETAAAIGTNLGGLSKLRSKGARLFDPSFPSPVGGLFIEAEILAWKKSKEEEAQKITQPSDQNSKTYDRRDGKADRRRT